MGVTLLAAIFVFGLLVLVHEFGHFITAKMTGMRVDEFAIGFGPKLWSKKYGETLYAIRMVPLGGFNRIAGMDYDIVEKLGNEEAQSEDEDEHYEDAGERAYFRRPIWARMIVILAGSFMNFILPIVLFFGIYFFAGMAVPSQEPVIGSVVENHAAAMAGMQDGDRILVIDDQEIREWNDITAAIQSADGKPFKVTFQRGDEVKAATLIPEIDESSGRAIIGITGSADYVEMGFGESIVLAVDKVLFLLGAMGAALVHMVQGGDASGLSGPIGVAQMAGQVAQQGFVPLLNFAAFLSLNLGLVNLLPVPALDGGHFVMLVLEALRGKPLGAKVMFYVQATGVTLLVSLMIFTVFNDLMR